jgi:DNA-binding GntR family transcriptional regulator
MNFSCTRFNFCLLAKSNSLESHEPLVELIEDGDFEEQEDVPEDHIHALAMKFL